MFFRKPFYSDYWFVIPALLSALLIGGEISGHVGNWTGPDLAFPLLTAVVVFAVLGAVPALIRTLLFKRPAREQGGSSQLRHSDEIAPLLPPTFKR